MQSLIGDCYPCASRVTYLIPKSFYLHTLQLFCLLYERHTKIWIERHDSVGADLCVCPGLAIAPLRGRHTGLPLRYPVLGVPGI